MSSPTNPPSPAHPGKILNILFAADAGRNVIALEALTVLVALGLVRIILASEQADVTIVDERSALAALAVFPGSDEVDTSPCRGNVWVLLDGFRVPNELLPDKRNPIAKKVRYVSGIDGAGSMLGRLTACIAHYDQPLDEQLQWMVG